MGYWKFIFSLQIKLMCALVMLKRAHVEENLIAISLTKVEECVNYSFMGAVMETRTTSKERRNVKRCAAPAHLLTAYNRVLMDTK